MTEAFNRALAIITAAGGSLRTRDALAAGVHPRTLYALRDNGSLRQLARGVFQMADLPPVGDPDLALVAQRTPNGVICLISALALHELTTQIPHRVHLAIPRSARYPISAEVPLSVYRFSDASFRAGIIEHDIGGAMIRTYDPEKSIADCFKYRSKLGLDIVIEAFTTYKKRSSQAKASLQRILDYAKINRVDNQIRPYLETLA